MFVQRCPVSTYKEEMHRMNSTWTILFYHKCVCKSISYPFSIIRFKQFYKQVPTFTDDAWKCDVHYDHRKLGRHCSVINVFVNHQTNTFRLLIFAVFPTFPSFNYLITWIITCDLIYIAFLKIYKTRKQLIQNISHQVFYRPNAFLPFWVICKIKCIILV